MHISSYYVFMWIEWSPYIIYQKRGWISIFHKFEVNYSFFFS